MILYVDNVKATYKDFTNGYHPWEFQEMEYIVPQNYTTLTLTLAYNNGNKGVWFDDITLKYGRANSSCVSSYNIVQNGSFEYPGTLTAGTLPDYWEKSVGSDAVVERVSSNKDFTAFNGKQMMKIGTIRGNGFVNNTLAEPLKVGKTYTAYAFVKTENVRENEAGAFIKLEILNASQNKIGEKVSLPLKGTFNDWRVAFVSLSYEEAKAINADATQIRVAFSTQGQTNGAMYFDMIRLVDENSRFEYTYTSDGNYVSSKKI